MTVTTSILLLILLACCGIIMYAVTKTFLLNGLQPEPLSESTPDAIPAGFELRLAEAIKFKTVSYDDQPIDQDVYYAFIEFIKASFPLLFAQGDIKKFNKHSLLISIKGAEPNRPPVVLMAHYDVVPVASTTLEQWQHPPFSGAVHEGFIYGRGALDDKCSLLGILESVEWLLSENSIPDSPLFIAIGHDEEVGGQGAAAIANYITNHYGPLRAVLDEGGVIAEGIVPGLDNRAVALVGTAEKGHASFQLRYSGQAGHASMPESDGAISKIARAIYRVRKKSRVFKIAPPVKGFFRYLGPEMPFLQRMTFANIWLFRRLLYRIFSKKGSTRALISTTYAPTIIHAGDKINVIPLEASTSINVRILPGETVESCQAQLRTMIDDPDIEIMQLPFANDPPVATDDRSEDFRLFGRIICTVFPDVLVSPYLTLATTDSRHYGGFAAQIFRFLPVPFRNTDLPRIHGINERIKINDYKRLIVFYRMFIEHFADSRSPDHPISNT